METAAALEQLIQLALTATTFLTQIQQIGQMVAKAQSEGRTTLTDAEWAQIKASADSSAAALATAILNAQKKA